MILSSCLANPANEIDTLTAGQSILLPPSSFVQDYRLPLISWLFEIGSD